MFHFLKSKKICILKFPVKGEAIDIAKVPDEVFASKMVGDGVGLIPAEGTVYAPIDGEIVQLFPSRHAIGMRTDSGLEILIHIGIDTVQMKGEGFTYLVAENQKVKAGERLMEFDFEMIKNQAKSIVTPVLITNMEVVKKIDFNYMSGDNNDTIMSVEMK